MTSRESAWHSMNQAHAEACCAIESLEVVLRDKSDPVQHQAMVVALTEATWARESLKRALDLMAVKP